MFSFEDFIPSQGFAHIFDFDTPPSTNPLIDEGGVSDDDFEDPLGAPRSTALELPDASSVKAVLEDISKMFEIVDYKIVTLASGVVMLYVWYRRKKGIAYPEKGHYA